MTFFIILHQKQLFSVYAFSTESDAFLFYFLSARKNSWRTKKSSWCASLKTNNVSVDDELNRDKNSCLQNCNVTTLSVLLNESS